LYRSQIPEEQEVPSYLHILWHILSIILTYLYFKSIYRLW